MPVRELPMAPVVLIIEDEPDLAANLEYNFTQAGYTPRLAGTVKEALALAAQSPAPDLVLLDLMLPDGSGVDVCRHLKSTDTSRHIPVVMLTAKGEEMDRVVGFEVGADDYVVKPFSVRELLLRVRAVLRRHQMTGPREEDQVVFGLLTIDSAAHRVWVNRDEVNLTALEFRLVTTLIARRGRVQTRDTLLRDVWDITADVTTRTVDTHVKRLRQKLGPAGDYIETVRGVGYRLCDEPASCAS
jgi:two-component system phosphate regulon response regulator PhoB